MKNFSKFNKFNEETTTADIASVPAKFGKKIEKRKNWLVDTEENPLIIDDTTSKEVLSFKEYFSGKHDKKNKYRSKENKKSDLKELKWK